MRPISPEAFDLLVDEAIARGANPHDLALVIYHESTWDPSVPNHTGAPYFGLNQMGESEARAAGFAGAFPAEWRALSAEKQLPYVFAFWRQKRAAIGDVIYASAAHLITANWVPAYMRGHHDPLDVDYVLCKAGNRNYDQNKAFDPQNQGFATLRSVAERLRDVRAKNPRDTATLTAGVAAACARRGLETTIPDPLGPAGGSSGIVTPRPPTTPPGGGAAGGSIASVLLLIGLVGGAAYLATR